MRREMERNKNCKRTRILSWAGTLISEGHFVHPARRDTIRGERERLIGSEKDRHKDKEVGRERKSERDIRERKDRAK